MPMGLAVFNRRRVAASLAESTGVLDAMELVAPERGLFVLNYHRVGSTIGSLFDDALYSATAKNFRVQIAYLQQRFALPPVHEVMASLTRGQFDEPTALITFDDGYRDNYERAFPVLRSMNVPACFFVVSGYLDSPSLPWWDHVAYAVKQTTVDVLRLDYPEPLEFDLQAIARPRVIFDILRAYKRTQALDQRRFFDGLAHATGVDVDTVDTARGLFMSWDDAREMHAAGMTFGSHTASHPVLASLPEDAQRRELVESRARIGQMLGLEPDLLAYPVGGPKAFTDTTKRLAHEAGYGGAFCFFGGLNRPGQTDPFAICRLGVSHTESHAQFRLNVTTHTMGGLTR